MQSLKFKQLLLLSLSTKSANQFVFQERLNLITAKDNSVGKSTLVKLIFWTLGCDPVLDNKWQNLDCKTLLDFTVGDIDYRISRYKNFIKLKQQDLETENFIKITGAFSKRLADIVGFRVLLANRSQNEHVLEVPPPAYYFSAFYIDQLKSWSKAWDNFESLQQYSNWKSTVIQYHVGLIVPKYFEIEAEIYSKKNEERLASNQLERINTALEVVSSYVPDFFSTVDQAEFASMTKEIEIDLNKLSADQEDVLEKLSLYESDKSYLDHQKIISEKIIKELDNDYKFTIEYLPDDEVVCPLCGVVHENSIVNRASILTDKQQAEYQLDEINKSIFKLEENIISTKIKLDKIKNKIDEINKKYVLDSGDKKVKIENYIDAFAVSSVQRKVEKKRVEKASEVKLISQDIKKLKTEQKALSDSTKIELIENSFVKTLVSFVGLLGANSINLSDINSPTDFNKIVKEGGAAEGTRGILAYYLAIYSIIEKFGNEVVSTMVIDTPNQHEQSIKNYDSIVDLISNKLPQNTQIILCAMDNEQLRSFSSKANVIYLDDKKLLDDDPEKFTAVSSIFDF